MKEKGERGKRRDGGGGIKKECGSASRGGGSISRKGREM